MYVCTYVCMYLFIYFWLCWVFVAAHRLSLVVGVGATLRCSAWASHCGGFSCGARAPGARPSVVVVRGLSSCGSWALERRLSSCLAAPRHVGSSRTRARTRVPCIGRQILNHCATRGVPSGLFHMTNMLPSLSVCMCP